MLTKQKFTRKDTILYGILFFLLCSIIIQSCLKQDILSLSFFRLDGPFWWSYWAIRAAVLGIFAWLLFFFENRTSCVSLVQGQIADRYESVRRHHDPLLGLRAMACFMVLLGHWFLVVFSPSAPTTDALEYSLRSVLSASPWGGVWIFFPLSGYLMGKGFVTGRHTVSLPGIRRFYRNRLLRIAPVYLCSIFLVTVLVHPEFLDFGHRDLVVSIFDCLSIDLSGGGVIEALWSISTEFQFYLLAPFLFIFICKILDKKYQYVIFGTVVVVFWALLKYAILFYYPARWRSCVYFPFLANIDSFLPGFLTAFLVQDFRNKNIYLKHSLSIGFIAMVFVYVAVSLWSYPEMVVFPDTPGSATRIYYLCFAPGAVSLAASCIIFLFEVSQRRPGPDTLRWKGQALLGGLTYCLYVWHEPVYLSFRKIFPEHLDFYQGIRLFPFGLALAFAMALLFYVFIEKSFDKKKSS